MRSKLGVYALTQTPVTHYSFFFGTPEAVTASSGGGRAQAAGQTSFSQEHSLYRRIV